MDKSCTINKVICVCMCVYVWGEGGGGQNSCASRWVKYGMFTYKNLPSFGFF